MNMLTRKNRTSAFTLPELAVVIFVIAVLVAVSYFGFSTWRNRVAQTELTSDLHNLYSAMESARNWGKGYPALLEGTVFDGTGNTQGVYASSENVTVTYFRGDGKNYCVNAVSKDRPDIAMHLNTKGGNKEPQQGACTENDGVVTTFIGDGAPNSCKNGVGRNASLYVPTGIDFASNGDAYMADSVCNIIRKITPDGTVSFVAGWGAPGGFADGNATTARFNQPRGVAVGPDGNIYVADAINHRIRKVTPTGDTTTLAGSGTQGVADGTGTAAQFNQPWDVDVDQDGNVYVADSYNDRIRKITPSGVVTTLAGSSYGSQDGVGAAARFGRPLGIAVSPDGSEIYVSDTSYNKIRKVTQAGVVTTLAGSGAAGAVDGTGTAAQFNGPRFLTVSKTGTIYVSDASTTRVRQVTPAGVVTTLAGSTSGYADGTGTDAQFNFPSGIAINSDYTIYVIDVTNRFVRVIR